MRGLLTLLASAELTHDRAAYSFVTATDVGDSGVATVHAALAQYSRLLADRFVPVLHQLLPPLLETAALDPPGATPSVSGVGCTGSTSPRASRSRASNTSAADVSTVAM